MDLPVDTSGVIGNHPLKKNNPGNHMDSIAFADKQQQVPKMLSEDHCRLSGELETHGDPQNQRSLLNFSASSAAGLALHS